MIADIYDVDELVKVNSLPEVTNPIIFNKGNIPTVDGLLSTEIFGRTPFDRKSIFAYIDLGGHFLNPVVYKNIIRMDKKLEKMVYGTKFFKINDLGVIEEVDEEDGGQTGLPYLYKIWDKIKWKESDALDRKERVKLIKILKKKEAFITKIPVCPAFYRDVNLTDTDTGKVSVGDINQIYSKIIRLSSAIKNDTTGLNIVGHNTRGAIQRDIVAVYDFFVSDNIKGKNGLFRKNVMGVSVDYGARLVISNNRFTQDKPNDMLVDFYKSGVPLAACCTMFYPFVLKWVKDLFYNEFYIKKQKSFVNAKGEIETVEIKSPENLISDEYISKAVDSYIHSYADRFKIIKIPTVDGKDMTISISGYYQGAEGGTPTSSTELNRPATWTDILYMACAEVTDKRHIIVTRYPVESPFASFPSKVTVLSTRNTKPAMINGKLYPNYPVIDPDLDPLEVSTLFVDTLNVSNLYLAGLGGDYDGDQVSVRGVFMDESNKECHEYMTSIKNLLTIAGRNIRTTEKEAIQAIYNLTKTRP